MRKTLCLLCAAREAGAVGPYTDAEDACLCEGCLQEADGQLGALERELEAAILAPPRTRLPAFSLYRRPRLVELPEEPAPELSALAQLCAIREHAREGVMYSRWTSLAVWLLLAVAALAFVCSVI